MKGTPHLSQVTGRNELTQVGETIVHPVPPFLLNHSVREPILRTNINNKNNSNTSMIAPTSLKKIAHRRNKRNHLA